MASRDCAEILVLRDAGSDRISPSRFFRHGFPSSMLVNAHSLGIVATVDSQCRHMSSLSAVVTFTRCTCHRFAVNECQLTLVQAFISSRRDCCSSLLLFAGITSDLMKSLQYVQNAAARLVTDTARRAHITTVLPVRQRLQFKLITLVYRSQYGSAPEYLADDY